MNCKKSFSKILAKFLLITSTVSCFGCYTYAMEQQSDEMTLRVIKKLTQDFLIYKSQELVNDNKASDYGTALLQVCYRIDGSFKNDLINFIKYQPGFYTVIERLNQDDSLFLLRKFSMEFLNKNIV